MFWVYLFSRSQGPEAWPLVLINLTIGRSCAVPLYLYFITPRTEQASVTA